MSEAEDQLAAIGAGRLQAFMTVLTEGEIQDGTTSIGCSKYLIFFPVLRRTLGLEIKIIAAPGKPTQYKVRTTELSNNQDAIAGQLYRSE